MVLNLRLERAKKMNFVGWHSQTLASHLSLTSEYQGQGYGFITLSIYGATSSPYYAAVMIQPAPAAQHIYATVPGSNWQQTFETEAAQGYGPAIIAATGLASGPLYAAVFEPQSPIPLTRNGLSAGNDPWNVQQINNSGVTGGPSATNELFVSVYNNQQHFAYLDGAGNVQDSWWGTDGWHLQQINNANGKGSTVSGEYIATSGPAAANNLFVCVYNNQQHFSYIDHSGNIQDAWYGTDGWHLQQINNANGAGSTMPGEYIATSGPAAANNLFVCVYNDQQHFSYIDHSGNIQDAWYGTDGWHLQQINNANGAGSTMPGEYIATSGPAASSYLFVSVYNDQQHFSYIDHSGNIQDAWYGTDGWHLQQINNANGTRSTMPGEYIATSGPAAVNNLFVCVYNDQQHFSYIDHSGNIQDAWYGTDGWHLQQINNANGNGSTMPGEYIATGGPAATSNLFVSVYGAQQHFSYIDPVGNIEDAWYDGAGWNFQTINNTGVTGGPAAVSGLFVCVYDNGDHFGYIDGEGNIQDASYDGGPMTIQAVNAQAKRQGLILRCAASYGDSSDPAFTAVWVPNTGLTLWNCGNSWNAQTTNNGILDPAGEYQGRFDAETSGWCRPAFVTLNASGQYLSLFVDTEIGPWWADHVLTPAAYQTAFDTWKAKGFYPVCVQAAGADAESATISAIFAQSQNVVPKNFTATGPVANAQIDAVIQEYMATLGTRHAGLAIVQGSKLVYARGYTLAEPDWPIAQPTTCFRLASVSKTVTALVIYQLIQEDLLQVSDTLQGILGLQTPTGGAPTDSRFSQITIRQLLDHTSGLAPQGNDDAIGILNAFNAVNPAAYSLPVSAAMTDSYVASLPLVSDPGTTQVYNNCAYYLLGRVIAKLRNQSVPVDGYQQCFFNPLSITRIRNGQSLITSQLPDEARYQNYNLPVYSSVMSNAQPLVPDVYGNVQLEIDAGEGGLSAAPTDLARLIAILISQQDNPAVTRATLVSMLQAGAAMSAAGNLRAGYGFDYVSTLSDGQFYAQKGGLLGSSASELQLCREWGFTMLWGNQAGPPGAPPPPGPSPYPDFPEVMDIAKKAPWGPDDLFPYFGMPSL
jgi:CubicO group peptidase (beta-lactamase class C family)